MEVRGVGELPLWECASKIGTEMRKMLKQGVNAVKEAVINNSEGSPAQGSELSPSSRTLGSPQKAAWAASSAGKFIKKHILNIQLHIRLLSIQGNLYLSL